MENRELLPARAGRYVRLIDVVTLLHNVRAGAASEEVGFEDANSTLQELTRWLNKPVWVPDSAIESALWSANLQSERERFWDARGMVFVDFVRRLCKRGERFNEIYNCFEKVNK